MAKKLNIFRLENGYLLLVDRAQKATGGGSGNEATLLLDLGALPHWFPAFCRSFGQIPQCLSVVGKVQSQDRD